MHRQPTPQELSIGRLAKLTKCQVVTVRYYERVGMLPEPRRSDGGHRIYGVEHLERLALIRRARELGFSLDDIRSILRLVEKPADSPCDGIDAIAARHLADVRRKIEDLREMERTLRRVLQRCRQTTLLECEVLGALRSGQAEA